MTVMASYLTAIASSTGVPLFIRSTGDLPQLSFPIVGSLNGVHQFTDNAKATLLSCSSGDVRIVWKNFHESLTLILITANDSSSEAHSNYLLTLVFNVMILYIGFHNLVKFDDVENLKRELRNCYPLIDSLLNNQTYISPLTQSVEVIVEQDSSLLMETLVAFTNLVQSGYGSIMINNQLLTATDSWWKLDPIELILLSLLPSTLPFAQCIDIPIYLPIASNTMAHRLLILHLYNGVYLMVLCDTEPPLNEAQRLASQTFLPLRDKILGLPLLTPRCLPLSIGLDRNVLGLCYVNIESHKCLISLLPSESGESNTTLLSKGYQGALDVGKRRSFLVQFYKSVVDDILPLEYPEREDREKKMAARKRAPHTLMETYTCTKSFKGYAINKTRHNLFVLFDVNAPTYTMRNVSHDILENLSARNILP